MALGQGIGVGAWLFSGDDAGAKRVAGLDVGPTDGGAFVRWTTAW